MSNREDISIRVILTEAGEVRVLRLHPEGPIENFYDDYEISGIDVLSAIELLAVYMRSKESEEDDKRQDQRDTEQRQHELYRVKSAILKDLPKQPGIYLIRCNANQKVYVGASRNMRERVKAHLSEAFGERSRHPIAKDATEFGAESISAEVLELVENESQLSDREQYWISKLNSIASGYNRENSHPHHSWKEEEIEL